MCLCLLAEALERAGDWATGMGEPTRLRKGKDLWLACKRQKLRADMPNAHA